MKYQRTLNKSAFEPPQDGLHESFYLNGKVSHRYRIKGGEMQGVTRQWHENGRLAEEKRDRQGLLHGICKQWNKDGKLLGGFRILNGTGMSYSWHPNGQVESEVPLVDGGMTGRTRIWGGTMGS